MFNWFRRNTDNWNTTGLQTAEELRALAASNPVVAQEVEEFLAIASQLSWEERDKKARRSCRALSGYGIAVAEAAFLKLLE